jgi:hypothetical protein
MSDINSQFLTDLRQGAQSQTPGEGLLVTSAFRGIASRTHPVFVRGESRTEKIAPSKQDIENEAIIPQLVIGKFWGRGQVVQRGIDRSLLDPTQIKDQFEIFTGVGSDVSVVGATAEEKGSNSLINGIPLIAAAASAVGPIANFLDWDLKEFLGLGSSSTDWQDIDPSGERGLIDPITGDSIVGLKKVADSINLEDLKNVASGAAEGDLIVKEGCEWVPKGFNVLLDEAGATSVIEVKDDGITLNSEVCALDIRDNLIPTDLGGGVIRLDAAVLTGATGPAGPVGNPGPGGAAGPPGAAGGLGATCPTPNPCDEDPGTTISTTFTSPPNVAGPGELLTVSSTYEFTVDVVNTNCIRLIFTLNGLYKERTVTPSNKAISKTFPGDSTLWPLDSSEANNSVVTQEAGTIPLRVRVIITNAKAGTDVVIHDTNDPVTDEPTVFIGPAFNPATFSYCYDICWNAINETKCLNRFPGILIDNTTTVKFQVTRMPDAPIDICNTTVSGGVVDTTGTLVPAIEPRLSSTDIYLTGVKYVTGDDWFDGGDNQSRVSSFNPETLAPPPPPAVDISDCGELPHKDVLGGAFI